MSRISLKPADFMQGKLVTPGWYRCKVVEVVDEAAKTDGSNNTVVDFTILADKFKGLQVRHWFNEKNPGLSNAGGYAKAFFTVDESKGGTFEFMDTKGKELEVYIINAPGKTGRMQNSCQDFRKAS